MPLLTDQPSTRRWWSSIWTRTAIGLALVPAYVLLLHRFAYLSENAIRTDSQTIGAAVGDVALWGAASMAGFGLFGILAALYFPNGRAVVPAWALVLLLLLVVPAIWLLAALTQAAMTLPDVPVHPSVGTLVSDMYLPVTLLVTIVALVQRMTQQPEHRRWRWTALTLGVVPFLAVTILQVVVIAADIG
ncbi:hypothetical protein [Arthrobacter sp. NPDC089319]|uniref:hypothetical protein n=1 Tax=Arthrobacter sp. NPDC089319 TaxID=3155915 RepID=UPI00342954C8